MHGMPQAGRHRARTLACAAAHESPPGSHRWRSPRSCGCAAATPLCDPCSPLLQPLALQPAAQASTRCGELGEVRLRSWRPSRAWTCLQGALASALRPRLHQCRHRPCRQTWCQSALPLVADPAGRELRPRLCQRCRPPSRRICCKGGLVGGGWSLRLPELLALGASDLTGDPVAASGH